MIEANTGDVFNIRVAIKQLEGALPANTVARLRIDEANTSNSSIASNSINLNFSSNASANDLILETRSLTYNIVNNNTNFARVSLEISNNYNTAAFNNKVRFWNMSITKNWAYASNTTSVPIFPTTVVLPKPQVNFQGFPTPAIKAADDITLTSPTVVNPITQHQMFVIKGISPLYIQSGGLHKCAFEWGQEYTGGNPNNSLIVYTRSTSNNFLIEVWSNGVNVGKSVNLPSNLNGRFCLAFTANTTQLRWSVNGGAVSTNNYTAAWSNGMLTSMKIGRSLRSTTTPAYLAGTIKLFRFERKFYSNAELEAISANVA